MQLRINGFVNTREERDGETLDCGASRAFALADHQVAHVHVRDSADIDEVREVLLQVDGIDSVHCKHDDDGDSSDESAAGSRSNTTCSSTVSQIFAEDRCGDLVAIAKPDAWFTYYYWNDVCENNAFEYD